MGRLVKNKGISWICMMAVMLSACGGENTVNSETETPKIVYEKVEDTSFEYEEQKPHIIVQKGYNTEDMKLIYVDASMHDSEFRIVDAANTENVVYSGRFYTLGAQEDTLCTGDFTEFNTPGRYRAWVKKYGYSHEFEIKDDYYSNLYRTVYERLEHIEAADYADKAFRISYMMLSGEIYENSYIDWVFINRQRDELTEDRVALFNASEHEKLAVAGVLAQYGILYMDLNEEDATESIEIAEELWDSCNDSQEDVAYYATVYLYRATGRQKYRQRLEITAAYEHGDYTFLADMGYIMSENETDFEQCRTILNQYASEAVKTVATISIESLMSKEADKDEISRITDALILTGVVDYAYNDDKYAVIRKKYAGYLEGCNLNRIDMLRESGEYTDGVTILSKILFILGD